MARHKDIQWNLPKPRIKEDGTRVHTIETIQAALLMDIRDELKQLNALLNCPNFIRLPRKLEAIRKLTAGIDRKLTK